MSEGNACGTCGKKFDKCMCWEPGGCLGNDIDHAVESPENEALNKIVPPRKGGLVGIIHFQPDHMG